MNGGEDPVNGMNGVNAERGTALEPKVFDAEFVTDDEEQRAAPRALGHVVRALVRRWWFSDALRRARSVAAYRMRKLPQDVVRLAWFVARGNWRWLVKAWSWATYADLRSDARAARLAGDSEGRRHAQELIRSDAVARWRGSGSSFGGSRSPVEWQGRWRCCCGPSTPW